ncbi:50S ribosomal protein L23 [Deltaproteobacteria bacterium PRO3]|nr:50S ribosomal protein L23 [Deltaproteobacteria bacterium PRO3]
MEMHEIIRRPLITEKGTQLREIQNQYLFEVDQRASKHQIKGAVEQLFKVHVEDVKTLVVRGKIKRVGRSIGKRSNWKKAYVTLKEGEKIEFFEGV